MIQDMSGDASGPDIDHVLKTMEHGRMNAFMTKLSLVTMGHRAYSRAQFEHLAAQSAFRWCDIRTEGIEIEVRLKKRHAAPTSIAGSSSPGGRSEQAS